MCKICKKVLRCGSTALRYHLKRTHSIEVNIVKRNIWNKSDVESKYLKQDYNVMSIILLK